MPVGTSSKIRNKKGYGKSTKKNPGIFEGITTD